MENILIITNSFRLLVVDMAPGVGSISVEFKRYLEAMQEIDSALVKSRKEADAILAKYEPVRIPFSSTFWTKFPNGKIFSFAGSEYSTISPDEP